MVQDRYLGRVRMCGQVDVGLSQNINLTTMTGKLHPLWRKNLQNALRENQTLPNCRFVQLSTMRINGTPASRTIVFRGFLEDPKGDPSSVLWFVGDLRTEKAEQVSLNCSLQSSSSQASCFAASYRGSGTVSRSLIHILRGQ